MQMIWFYGGYTEEEFQKKLEITLQAFDNLGLQLSVQKSELQYNKMGAVTR